MPSDYYDRKGRPISTYQWGRLHRRTEYVVVEKTKIEETEVSTVWLGIDHNFGVGRPVIFETAIFGGPYDMGMWRYTTEEEARSGHENIVACLLQGTEPDIEPNTEWE